ncbi:hypothetical protein [Paenibacillus tarimensis]|uniref:hypothetical protein n=1 Tax=Paenibacillus tarimensis TaxID=416012 RepID=UPI001F323838|nr:hypothetical protein [Paenibacillus tarimensis]MCF2942230.1 hypothetical protein [Paenibacillus tarimensis]
MEPLEDNKWKNLFWMLGYSTVIGLLLAVFSFIPGLIRFVFSLGALLLGIRFFGKYDSIGLRIGMIVLSVVFIVLFIMIGVIIMYANGMLDQPAV